MRYVIDGSKQFLLAAKSHLHLLFSTASFVQRSALDKDGNVMLPLLLLLLFFRVKLPMYTVQLKLHSVGYTWMEDLTIYECINSTPKLHKGHNIRNSAYGIIPRCACEINVWSEMEPIQGEIRIPEMQCGVVPRITFSSEPRSKDQTETD